MSLSLQDVIDAVNDRKVTQAALAVEAGLTQPAVSFICSGKTKSVSYDNAMALIAAGKRLGIKPQPREKAEEKQKESRDAVPAGKAAV